MSLHFHKVHIQNGSSALADLLKTFEEYNQRIEYPEDDQQRHDECSSNLVLFETCLARIKEAVKVLESKIDKMEELYMSVKSKTDQKEMIADIEELEKETQYSKILKDAAAFVFNIETNMADAKIKLQKVQLKLRPVYQGSLQDESAGNEETGETRATTNDGSETNSVSNRKTRTIKPPTITLPKFYGNQEEFPEFWAVYESLIHENDDLSTIEKIVLLKDSLKGSAEKAIRGIKPVASNYSWMVETISKRFGNKPTNRSKIVQKLFDLKAPSKGAESCQDCFDAIKTLLHQMVSAGYDIRDTTDPMWTETILQKFPYEIVKDILVKNQETETMKVGTLLDVLEREIVAKAYVELRLGTFL